MPDVSVIIPCYNHANYLGEALDSVLAQTHPASEIIVVDDGSKDASVKVAQRYALEYPTVRVIQQANAGRSAAANHGLRESRSDFLVFLDADDCLLPQTLATNLATLEAHPEIALAAGHCVFVDSNGNQIDMPENMPVIKADYTRLLHSNFIWNPGAALFRRSAVEAVGGFDMTLKHAEDYSIYLRIARDHAIFYDQTRILARYRQHPNNKSKNAHTMLPTVLAIQRAETPYAERTPEMRQALAEGIEFTRWYYGQLCVRQLYANLGAGGDLRKAWATFKTILLYCPTAFAQHFKRELKATLKSSLRPDKVQGI